MRAARTLLVLAGLALLSTTAFVCQRVADRGRFAAPWSSYGAGPEGTRGLYLLAQELGARPQRWAQDLARLPEHGGMLIALSDCRQGMARPLSRFEQAELKRWVERGGVLLVAGAHDYLPADFPIAFDPSPSCMEGTESLGADDDAPLDAQHVFATADPLRELPPILMRGVTSLSLDPDAKGAIVLLERPTFVAESGDATGSEVVGAAARLGRGHVIALGSGSPLQNAALLEHDGGALFARLLAHYAPAGPLLFDEYHLGLGERRSAMRYFRQAGATPYILQALLIAVVLLFRSGARFGGALPPPEPAPGGTASFVAALGALFERAHDPAGTTQILARQAHARIAAHHHLAGLSPQRLAEQLRARGRADAAQALLTIARPGQVLADAGYDLVVVSQRFDDAVAKACEPLAAEGDAA